MSRAARNELTDYVVSPERRPMSLRASTKRPSDKDSTRLRMDSYGGAGGASASRVSSSGGSRPGRAVSPPKRRELDKVMKKARSRDGATQSNYWNKKLLEAEEKDPNRWRHSGYKELYGGGGGGGGGGSPSGSRASKGSRSRGERGRQRSRDRRPHTPQPTTSSRAAGSKATRSSPPKVVSLSQSSRSLSSCSDESCSVCSPKPRGAAPRKKPAASVAVTAARQPAHSPRSRSRSFSVPRSKPTSAPQPPPSGTGVSSRLGSRRAARRRSSPPRDPRGPPPSPPPRAKPPRPAREAERVKPSTKKRKSSSSKSGRSKPRRPPPAAAPIAAPVVVIPEVASSSRRHSSPAVSCSDESSCSSVESSGAPPKLTLSERFGKMAQWSVDRRDLDGVKNMRITKDTDGSDLKVVIEDARYRAGSPMPASDRRTGAGFYPEALHSAPTGLDAWDDVRVRYKYYKDRGYLRDLTLDDYMKWEEWWYKYQEWLDNERCFERWETMRAEQGGMYYDRLKRGGRRAARDFH